MVNMPAERCSAPFASAALPMPPCAHARPWIARTASGRRHDAGLFPSRHPAILGGPPSAGKGGWISPLWWRVRGRAMSRLSASEIVLARATKHAVQAARGLEICAQETGLSTSHISRCCSADHRDSLTIRDAEVIDGLGQGDGGHPHILRALARLAGMVVVPLPTACGDADGLAASIVAISAELGDVAASIRAALADHAVSPREARHALDELDGLDAASAALRGRLMRLAYPNAADRQSAD